VAGLAASFGSGAMTNPIKDIGGAACIMAVGTNPSEAHPVIALDIMRAVKKGAKLIVINPREIRLNRIATMWLRLKPGTDVPLLMGMAKIILDEGLEDKAFLETRCENFDAFKESLDQYGLESVEKITGVLKDQIVAAARMYAKNSPASILYTLGITEHNHGVDNVMALANLSMITGNIGKSCTGVNPLRGQNNVQGACDMGSLPNLFVGYQSVADPKIRQKFEAAWGVKLSDKPGLTETEMIDAAAEGKIKAMYIIGENLPLSEANANHTLKALRKLEFLVVQDIFPTETTREADVILPGASFAEKDGTFTNTERRVQRVRKAIDVVGNARPDWWITCELARRMGAKGFDYDNPEKIMNEVNRLTPSYTGVTYDCLEKCGLQWPCPEPGHPGTPVLHDNTFSRGKGKLAAIKYRPSSELPDAEYPFMLTTGRSLFQYNTITMTGKMKGLMDIYGEDTVDISPEDARKLRVADKDWVKLTTRRGTVNARVKITTASSEGVVYMNFHFAENCSNILTNNALDPVAKTPEYKVCAVKIEKIEPPIAEKQAEKVK
jgi:formate dehydrogenase alpha subunit